MIQFLTTTDITWHNWKVNKTILKNQTYFKWTQNYSNTEGDEEEYV